MSVLEKICTAKKTHIDAKKVHEPLSKLKEKIQDAPPPKDFLAALKAKAPSAIIAEIKKASPSKGTIREDFNPVDIANTYYESGAACLSVLTDTPYFQGSDEDFQAVRAISPLPMLRKDFMLDPYQIYESRAMGADCILLIMAALTDQQAQILFALATDLGMTSLIETHDHEELERAKSLTPPLIGINNRNLKTLNVTLETSQTLAANMPKDSFMISESGISSHADITMLQEHGYQGFLIGESLMKSNNITEKLKNLQKVN